MRGRSFGTRFIAHAPRSEILHIELKAYRFSGCAFPGSYVGPRLSSSYRQISAKIGRSLTHVGEILIRLGSISNFDILINRECRYGISTLSLLKWHRLPDSKRFRECQTSVKLGERHRRSRHSCRFGTTHPAPAGSSLIYRAEESQIPDHGRLHLSSSMAAKTRRVWGIVGPLRNESRSANAITPASTQIATRPNWFNEGYGKFRNFSCAAPLFPLTTPQESLLGSL